MNPLRNHWAVKLLPALLLTAAGIFMSYQEIPSRWNHLIYDSLTRAVSRLPDRDIVILAIDDASLAEIGRWPWPRRIQAEIVDKLTAAKVRAIGFDILFSEADTRAVENDHALAAAIEHGKRVILPMITTMDLEKGALQITMPIGELADAAAGLGLADVEPDADGVLRRVFLTAGLGKPDWPTLALAMLRFAEPGYEENLPGVRNPRLGKAFRDNWIRDHEILLPFCAPAGGIPHISCREFLQPDFDLNRLRDKYVLIGTTAAGLNSSFPVAAAGRVSPMSSVEIHANLLDTLKQQAAIVPMDKQLQLVLTTFFILLPFVYFPRLKPAITIPLTLGLLLSIVVLSFILLNTARLWYAPAPALLLVTAGYLFYTWGCLKTMVNQLYRVKEQAKVTLNSIGEGVITTDNTGRIRYINPVAETLTGYRDAEAKNLTLGKILPIMFEHMDRDLADIVERCIQEKKIIQPPETGIMVNRLGDEHTVRISVGPLHDRRGTPRGVIISVSDVTESDFALQQIAYQASHDALTGLANRTMLIERMQHAISQARRSKRYLALLLIDLDDFKQINSRFGYNGGDLVLETIADRLLSSCRDGDTVARIGGNEFAVFLENLQHSKLAATVASKLLALINQPCRLEEGSVSVNGSIGISLFPKDGEDPKILLKNSNIALHRCKENGGGSFRFFSLHMHTRIRERMTMEKNLARALEDDELQVRYQPRIRLRDGKITGVEALVLWHSEEMGLVPAETFLPVAEECDLGRAIGSKLLATALDQAATWQQEGIAPLTVHIPLLPCLFFDEEVVEKFRETALLARNRGISLELEIPEDALMKDIERSIALLTKFRKEGGRVAIDAFGAGHSSLASIKQFPVCSLKIDPAITLDLAADSKNRALTAAIISMAHGFDLRVVAGGVTTAAQASILKKLQCDEIQGFPYPDPRTPEEIIRLIGDTPSSPHMLRPGGT